jgi:hypothetical protein
MGHSGTGGDARLEAGKSDGGNVLIPRGVAPCRFFQLEMGRGEGSGVTITLTLVHFFDN